MDWLVSLALAIVPIALCAIWFNLVLIRDLVAHIHRWGTGNIMPMKGLEGNVDTGFLDAGVSANVTPEKGFAGHVDINAQPNANAAVSGVAGAAAYTWLAGLAGPWTPFLLLGAGGAWLLARHVKQVKAAKG